MKYRSALLSTFMSFLNKIKNQIGEVIKIFRSDNAKEYFPNFSKSSKFTRHLT